MENIEIQYISAACNPVQHCLSVQDPYFAYGACAAVIFGEVDTDNNRLVVKNAKTAHSDRVNCVRFLSTNDAGEKGLVSGSTDKTVCLWIEEEVVQVFRGHQGSVTVVDGLLQHNLIASASTDSTLRIWNRKDDIQSSSNQVIQIVNNGFVLDLALVDHAINPWIIASLDDCSIHLYVQENGSFEFCHRLRGHEDWVQSLSVTFDPENGTDILLASGGQDTFIRVWRFTPISKEKALADQRSVLDLCEDEDIEPKAQIVTVSKKDDIFYTVVTDTILSGHDDKVFGVQWSSTHQGLISASMDKTMIFWQQKQENLWTESVRVGDVGGNTLGFLGCALSANANWFLGYTFSGALHLWSQNDEGSSTSWNHGVVCGGHYAPVQDLDWDNQGRYLVSTSQDQTTRIHAHWQPQHGWYEVARPQVHGYDLSCLTMLPNHQLASGAEEKLIRVFEAPQNFLKNMNLITGLEFKDTLKNRAQGASVPSLGLSNKAVQEGEAETPEVDKHVKDQFPDFYFKNENYQRPPAEDILVQNTLWPEVAKLYGHGYEIFSVASNQSGTLLASACKASQSEHANIILWDTEKWTKVTHLYVNGHNLTVVQMAFSPDGKYLLSVSRDRTLIVWNLDDYSVAFKTDKHCNGHQRIIWACDWTADSTHFVTVGRDKKCILWSLSQLKVVSVLNLPAAATAVSFMPELGFSIVLGLENGQMYRVKFDDGTWSDLVLIEANKHHRSIKKLKFRPNCDEHFLASCGTDHIVQLLKFASK